MTTILEEAEALVNGSRQEEYGAPSENLQRVADIWTAVLGVPVTLKQVCLCMAGLKLARASAGESRDSLVDLVGYARLIEMCPANPPPPPPPAPHAAKPGGLGRRRCPRCKAAEGQTCPLDGAPC